MSWKTILLWTGRADTAVAGGLAAWAGYDVAHRPLALALIGLACATGVVLNLIASRVVGTPVFTPPPAPPAA